MQQYVYRLETDNEYRVSVFNKQSPKQACISIFRRILRDCKNEELVQCVIIVKNIIKNREYIYDCRAVYRPYNKIVSYKKNKIIVINFDINILKLNNKCFE